MWSCSDVSLASYRPMTSRSVRIISHRVADELQLEVLPLYGALQQAAQSKIFAPTAANFRRIIVSTNIAETSITIPGVAYVVDTGYKKEKGYIYRTSGGRISCIPLARHLTAGQPLSIWRRSRSAKPQLDNGPVELAERWVLCEIYALK